MSEFSSAGAGDSSGGRVLEWELGLPTAADLTPLSQTLIPPSLASAFSISPAPSHTPRDVHRASLSTLSSLRALPADDDPVVLDGDPPPDPVADDPARATKRARLVWTPQLHKRFVEVVAHLGVRSAVPTTIMQMMNVEGLTRENVASHLQKYRLFLKRSVSEGPSSSDPPVSYSAPPMVPMPVFGQQENWRYHGYELHHHSYGMFGQEINK